MKRKWILAGALLVLVGLVIATLFVLRSPAYHARLVREDEIWFANDRIVAFGHARALLEAKARDEVLPRALEERDPDWKFRSLAIALVTTGTKASEDELRVLVRSLAGGPLLRWPAIIALSELKDLRTLDALTARALRLREEIEKLPPSERWHPEGDIDPTPPDRELWAVVRAILVIDEQPIDPSRPWEVTFEEVKRLREDVFEKKRAALPPQVLPR